MAIKCSICGRRLGFNTVVVRALGLLECKGLKCRKCNCLHPVRHYRNQSLKYVDVIAKFIFLGYAVWFLLNHLYVGALCLLLAVMIINTFLYYILIKLGLLILSTPEVTENGKETDHQWV